MKGGWSTLECIQGDLHSDLNKDATTSRGVYTKVGRLGRRGAKKRGKYGPERERRVEAYQGRIFDVLS